MDPVGRQAEGARVGGGKERPGEREGDSPGLPGSLRLAWWTRGGQKLGSRVERRLERSRGTERRAAGGIRATRVSVGLDLRAQRGPSPRGRGSGLEGRRGDA